MVSRAASRSRVQGSEHCNKVAASGWQARVIIITSQRWVRFICIHKACNTPSPAPTSSSSIARCSHCGSALTSGSMNKGSSPAHQPAASGFTLPPACLQPAALTARRWLAPPRSDCSSTCAAPLAQGAEPPRAAGTARKRLLLARPGGAWCARSAAASSAPAKPLPR